MAGKRNDKALAAGTAVAATAAAPQSLRLFSPAGVVAESSSLTRAKRRLSARGYQVTIDEAARARHQRFAGDDDARLAALHRTAHARASIAMATRGGYGLSRLLDRIDYRLLARSVEQGCRWVGHSDFTALSLAMLAHTASPTWAGPMACFDFGRTQEQGGMDETTADCFDEAMGGVLEAVGFRTEAGFDGLNCRGLLWGGNLSMITALLGTRHWPRIRGGILFLEDVNEHPYRIERQLLQLHQAGVLETQKAVVLGPMTAYTPSPLDRGYTLRSMLGWLRGQLRVPVLTGLPFGHVPTKVCLPVGARSRVLVDGRDAFLFFDT